MGGEGADEATVKKLNDAVVEASQNAQAAGYTPNAIQRIISTPSDVSMFSRLPEADQKAVLRQADDKEFERYVTHAKMKIRAQAREERRGDQVDVNMPATRQFPKPSPAASAPAPAPAPDQRRRHSCLHPRREGGRRRSRCCRAVRRMDGEFVDTACGNQSGTAFGSCPPFFQSSDNRRSRTL